MRTKDAGSNLRVGAGKRKFLVFAGQRSFLFISLALVNVNYMQIEYKKIIAELESPVRAPELELEPPLQLVELDYVI